MKAEVINRYLGAVLRAVGSPGKYVWVYFTDVYIEHWLNLYTFRASMVYNITYKCDYTLLGYLVLC